MDTGECYTPDAGDAGPGDAGDATPGDAGDAGDAEPECTQSSQCADPSEPICDTTDLECRACQSDPECQSDYPSAPYCAAPSCVECTDSALHCTNPVPICESTSNQCRACADHGDCAARSPSAPACAAPSCVECTDSALHCTGTAPVCEATTNQCRPCASHAECALAGGVCDWVTGACLSESEVIYVDEQAPLCSDAGGCTQITPCCTLQVGVDTVSPGRTTILVADGTYDRIDVVDTGDVWIVGGGASVLILELSLSAQIYISGTSDVVLENLTVGGPGASGPGIECDGNVTTQPTLTLTSNTLSGNAGGGVTATSCTISLDGNTLSGNAGGGVSLSSSDFTLVNNIIAQNGGGTSSYGGVMIVVPGTIAEFWHNTVVDNFISTADPAGIRCIDAVDIVSTLLYDNLNADLSPSCVASFSWTTADGDPLFVGAGDYHLQPGSSCVDQGDPATTVDHDIDGDARPQGGGPDIGADETQ